jgi:hypothetical protein
VCRFPAAEYPVLALRGAPASFPVQEEHVALQRHLVWSAVMDQQTAEYVQTTFHGQPYVAIHLRNGVDWVRFTMKSSFCIVVNVAHLIRGLGVLLGGWWHHLS